MRKLKRKSNYYGVYKSGNYGYTSFLRVNDKIIYLVFSKSELELAKTYDKYIKTNSLKNRLNFPDDIGYPPYENSKYIILSNGLLAIVDSDVYELASQIQWTCIKSAKTYYATSFCVDDGRKKQIRLHTFIMGVGNKYDHINGNGLDNRRCNLRACTQSENNMNRGVFKSINSTSRYKGVSLHSRVGKLRAVIKFNGKSKHLGYFSNEIDAAKAYDQKAIELFGEFARLNFPEQ